MAGRAGLQPRGELVEPRLACAAVLRQAQDEGGVRGKVSYTPVVSLSINGDAGVVVLRQAHGEAGDFATRNDLVATRGE